MSTPTPKPGQHLPGPPQTVDPQQIHAEVDDLLAGLTAVDPQDHHRAITHQAHVLERAHEVLVQALATVDKI
ncbi:conserved hypothetical protein [Rhodococcus sp. RD6.2]|uniref:hypothetical protein n=1 Tax=Rhodococcus sp. RD6.2 TaxID=260936 RepID=UPI00063B17EA|nr:hypothetical protein [Rhodococcus sp. RD6.2]CRK51334.1 conserved hypothetical protein [Rhodococcus sp. RD6.2]